MSTESEDLRSLIELYVLGELEKDKIPLVEEFLRKDPQAREELKKLQEVITTMSEVRSEEPSSELCASTKGKVYSLMPGDSEPARVSLGQLLARFFMKPVHASAAAVLVLGICLAVVFVLSRSPGPGEDIAKKGPDTEVIGSALTEFQQEFKEYVKDSADIFSEILEKGDIEIKQLLDKRDLTVDIAKAMKLVEDPEIENSDDRSLLKDIDAAWRGLLEFQNDPEGNPAQKVKDTILVKEIIERAIKTSEDE